MDNKIIIKAIRKKFKTFLNDKGFKLHSRNIFIKEKNDMLQIISIFVSGLRVYCDIAIQPLYVESEVFMLSFGSRINKFQCDMSFRIIKEEQDLKDVLDTIDKLLKKNVFKWFEKYSSPEGLISFTEIKYNKNPDLLIGYTSFPRFLFLGYSYLYIKQYETGIQKLKLILEQFENSNYDWQIKIKSDIDKIISIAKKSPDLVEKQLNENIIKTKTNIKIK